MSMKTFCSARRHREQRLLLNVGKSKRDEDEDKDVSYLQQLSSCPACNGEYDVTLMLPCSHIMCGRCVAAGEGKTLCQPIRHKAARAACTVFCPCCQHPVELPCWTWSSATSCLPKYPTLNVKKERGTTKEAIDESLQSLQRDCGDACDVAARGSLHDPGVSKVPADHSLDLQEEEMEQSVHGIHFALDPSHVPPSIHLSNSFLSVTYQVQNSPLKSESKHRVTKPDSKATVALPLVCADVVIGRGQYYWEVDVCNSPVYRVGVSSSNGSRGWWLERQGKSFSAVYDGTVEPIFTVPPQIKTLGVFLNIGGGVLSFHNPVTQEHLATLPTCFDAAGVTPAVGLGQGRLRLRCRLPPPPYIFFSKNSAYREPRGDAGGQWCRYTPFQSVRKVIQKFEELAASDSDVVSSLGSSCSTLASYPEPMGL